ncbi:uncharacterized protein MICPUCDRAFT_49347 [Micromonas pusilla CCMP1545]|uniref:Predicted protein n=1 Tax=Micromonas pusilla (strain CCMP1545) TaxID=564608 RepID=C1NAH7_MICPC|nr:uncharacterized protein MICPUCDRAFT_49347 [Micromonas pusilla CCMP1545]EEH50940.1 predicted protein [Micromonas pusilla CCMP1545]|eukprot:XP_003064960.1 predicted protein [Micromonas pusilla CCMP1545]
MKAARAATAKANAKHSVAAAAADTPAPPVPVADDAIAAAAAPARALYNGLDVCGLAVASPQLDLATSDDDDDDAESISDDASLATDVPVTVAAATPAAQHVPYDVHALAVTPRRPLLLGAAARRASRVSTVRRVHRFALDSGAAVHVANDRGMFNTYKPERIAINPVAPVQMFAHGSGTVRVLISTDNDVDFELELTEVLHIPEQPFNLISLSRLEDAGWRANFETRQLTLSGSRVNGSIDRINGLY